MPIFWKLNPPRAQCEHSGLKATLDLRSPHKGLQLAEGCQVLGVRCLGDELLEPSDCYQRGADLVATYPHRPEFPVRVQIYWRVVSPEQLPPHAAGIDLQVSVQTPLLAACPRVTASSELRTSGACRLLDESLGRFVPLDPVGAGSPNAGQPRPGCTLVRGAALDGRSYVEMVHPQDDSSNAAEWSGQQPTKQLRLSHTLFADSLEKGVILRARLRGILLPQSGDEAAALNAYASFIAAELPLTT